MNTEKMKLLHSSRDQLIPLCSKYPLFVVENLGAEEDGSTDHIFYSLHDPLSNYQCQIPELLGRHIRGYYYGWIILSDHPQNVTWSLWNPVTSETINFPSLILKDGDSISIGQCCLSAPPHDPTSVLLLTRTNKPTFVFLRLASKKKKLRWIEMSYASQLKRITGEDGLFISSLACCNGKVYALNFDGSYATFVIQLDMVFRENEVLIKLLLLGIEPPSSFRHPCTHLYFSLKGSCTELFYIRVGFYEGTLEAVYLFKLDMTSIKAEEMERFVGLDMSNTTWEEVDNEELYMSGNMWEEVADLKDAIFYVNLACDRSVYYTPAIASEFGGYIHIRDPMGKILYSYHVKENTISLSSMPSLVQPTSNVSIWECRNEDEHGKGTVDSKQTDNEIVLRSFRDHKIESVESCLLNLPYDILEMILGLCVGVEYMNFRATCKRCHLAGPRVQWSIATTLRRLKTYSLTSPWLMVVDENQDIITFTDPVLSDNYFMKNLHVSPVYHTIYCSRFGWLLFRCSRLHCLVFYNPFNGYLHKLPTEDEFLESACFSAPPTSPDCMVVGFTQGNIYIHFVAQEPSWRALGVGTYSVCCPTFMGRDLYALHNEGELVHFKDLGADDYSVKLYEDKAPSTCCRSTSKYYLMTHEQYLLLVVVGKLGESVEVFKKSDYKQEWEKLDTLGKHVIYISRTSCLCFEATTPEMENKIYFPLLHSKSRKIVFYSLETCMYHTFDDKNIQQQFKDFLGTTYHLFPHVWIEPNWS